MGCGQIFGGNFFDARKERNFGGNFLRFRKGEVSVEIFEVSAREGFDPNFFDVRKRGFLEVVVDGVVEVEVEVV